MEQSNNRQDSSINNENHIEWGGFLNEFLWVCAGVDRKVLRQCPAAEYAKYAGIGGTILFTALMAMLSGGYAMKFVFDSVWLAIAFGIFWGLLIFNLDRFIVNTMYSDGKPTISGMELLSGLPRIIMAIFLGIVISTPLELKIFDDAIDIRIEQDKDDLVKIKIGSAINERDSIAQKRDDILTGVTLFDTQITTSSTTTNSFLSEINVLQQKLNVENATIRSLDEQIRTIRNQINTMDSNDPSRGEIINRLGKLRHQKQKAINQRNIYSADIRRIQGEAAASDATLRDLLNRKQSETTKESERLQNEVDSLNRYINDANTRHPDWSEDIIKVKGSYRDKLDVEYKGFQAKMHAFSELKEESSDTYISSWFIMLLFIIIETAPTFFKMMMTSGPYDDKLRVINYEIRAKSDCQINIIEDCMKTELKIATEKNKARLAVELKANEDILKRLASSQSELIETAIEEWRKQELEKVKTNPSDFINSSTTNPQ